MNFTGQFIQFPFPVFSTFYQFRWVQNNHFTDSYIISYSFLSGMWAFDGIPDSIVIFSAVILGDCRCFRMKVPLEALQKWLLHLVMMLWMRRLYVDCGWSTAILVHPFTCMMFDNYTPVSQYSNGTWTIWRYICYWKLGFSIAMLVDWRYIMLEGRDSCYFPCKHAVR